MQQTPLEEHPRHQEVVNCHGDGQANYPGVIVTQRTQASKPHAVPHEHVQLPR